MRHRMGAMLNVLAAIFVLFVAMLEPPLSAVVALTLLLALAGWTLYQPHTGSRTR